MSHWEGLAPSDTSILKTNSVPHWYCIQCSGLRLQIPIPEFLEVQTDLFLRSKEFEGKKKISTFHGKKKKRESSLKDLYLSYSVFRGGKDGAKEHWKYFICFEFQDVLVHKTHTEHLVPIPFIKILIAEKDPDSWAIPA